MSDRPFDPGPYIRQIRGRGGGSDYLDVKWRLLWLRGEHSDAQIETEVVEHRAGEFALVRAHIALPTGGRATGYGSETKLDFPDYLEKAETKAIGRALNALGYSVEAANLADGGEPESDPLQTPNARERLAKGAVNPETGELVDSPGTETPITETQVAEMSRLKQLIGWEPARLNDVAKRLVGAHPRNLTTKGASTVIHHMQQMVRIEELRKELRWNHRQVDGVIQRVADKPIDELTSQEWAAVIAAMEQRIAPGTSGP